MSRLDGDLLITGLLQATGSFRPPPGSIGNDDLATDLANPIETGKMQARLSKTWSQEGPTAFPDVADVLAVLHKVTGPTATLIKFECGVITPFLGDAIVSIDLIKNGTTVLDSFVVIDSSVAAFGSVAGTINVPGAAMDEVYYLQASVAPGTGTVGKGLFCNLLIDENP